MFITRYSFSQTTFIDNYSDYLNSVIQTPDSNYIATGGLSSISVIKFNQNGQLIWSKVLNIQNSSSVYNTGNGIVNTTDGGFAVSGTFKGNPVICKLDAFGNIQWTEQYNFNTSSAVSKVLQTNDGGYLLATSVYPHDSATTYIIKTNSRGRVQWAKNYFTNRLSQVTDLIKTEDGNYGFVTINSQDISLNGDTSYIVKINSKGNVIMSSYLFNPVGLVYAHNLVSTSDSGYLVTGHELNNQLQGFTVKLNKHGKKMWSKSTPNINNKAAYFNAGLKTNDGKYLLYGNITGPGGFDSTFYFFTEISNTGIQQWSKTIYSNGSGGSATNIFSVITTKDHGYLGVGSDATHGPGVILRLDSNFNSCRPEGKYDGLLNFTLLNSAKKVPFTDANIKGDSALVTATTAGFLTNSCSKLPVKFIDKNEKYIYSTGASINFKGTFSVFPNPVNSNVNISIPPVNNISEIELYDLAGKKLMNVQIPANTSSKQLNITELAPGIYILDLHQNGIQQTIRLIKN
jgi:hypothetical protein